MITKHTKKEEVLALAPACSCDECKHGCTIGSGILVEDDLKHLAAFLKKSEKQVKEELLEEVEQFNKKQLRPKLIKNDKPYGQCTFYDEEKGCTVHDAKPLQCKIAMGCKEYGEQLSLWFMLNYLIDKNDPEAMRQFHQYLKTGGKTLKGGSFDDLIPDKKQQEHILNYGELKQHEHQH